MIHAAFDALFLAVWGFPPGGLPIWQSDQWWTDFLNAAVIGYLPAAQAIAQRGVERDLAELRPQLRCSDAEMSALSDAARGPRGPIARVLSLGWIALGVGLVFSDPAMSRGATASSSDPTFIWALVRTMLSFWLIGRFWYYDFSVTRIYLALGRDSLRIDLLDIQALAPFARRGQRSALTWVLLSSLLSLFWFGDSAGAVNLPGLILVLSMATFAFVGPLAALRQTIRAAKHAELGRLREQIRDARSQTETAVDSPRLANLVSYYQLIDSAREWPVDAAILLRFVGYLVLGLGSWLGGAVVERMLDSAIPG